jgi:cell pole-organizing protein PopZ
MIQSIKGTKAVSNTVRQLRLVPEQAPQHGTTTDPTRAAFERWVFMFGKNPKRCKLDAERAAVIRAAIQLFDAEAVDLAIDGMASLSLADKPSSMVEAMREISWFLASAKRIERAIAHGEALHAAVAAPEPVAPQISAASPEERAAQAEGKRQAMEALRARTAALRAAHG